MKSDNKRLGIVPRPLLDEEGVHTQCVVHVLQSQDNKMININLKLIVTMCQVKKKRKHLYTLPSSLSTTTTSLPLLSIPPKRLQKDITLRDIEERARVFAQSDHESWGVFFLQTSCSPVRRSRRERDRGRGREMCPLFYAVNSTARLGMKLPTTPPMGLWSASSSLAPANMSPGPKGLELGANGLNGSCDWDSSVRGQGQW